MSKHTPGPWLSYKEDDPRAHNPMLFVGADGFGDIAQIGGGLLDVRTANARLIAAAPDLLAACQEALSVARLDGWNQAGATRFNAFESLRAAIDKASPAPSVAKGGADG